jgi:BlaI family transcriptional regulator, penicillinase repressor
MRPKSPTLTAHELQIMDIIWQHSAGVTVRDVYEALRAKRPIAYTTVMTNLKTLERKGYLKTSQQERAYLYRPVRPKQQVVRAMVREFIDRVFDGSARPLLLHMLEDDQLTDAELQDITKMMRKKK